MAGPQRQGWRAAVLLSIACVVFAHDVTQDLGSVLVSPDTRGRDLRHQSTSARRYGQGVVPPSTASRVGPVDRSVAGQGEVIELLSLWTNPFLKKKGNGTNTTKVCLDKDTCSDMDDMPASSIKSLCDAKLSVQRDCPKKCKLECPTCDDNPKYEDCLLYTSDAADDLLCVDLGGRRIIKTKKKCHTSNYGPEMHDMQ
eukprot:TRINITY_DN14553_c0_g1_i1.p1 TRINITY_DN14553_c0_g1~~TRINITY_DN14553_c0_g1_i1.p1  ORF type:complete len:198 (+),score=50.76 TRINITY_DN14553_c0_g1_i1:175-768(+)